MKKHNLTKQQTPFKNQTFTQIILLAIKNLDSSILHNLSDNKPISYDEKHEFIEKLKKIIEGVRRKNIKSLKYEVSKCKFCFPDALAFTFYDEESGYALERYVITENERQYIFQRCTNSPILSDKETGMPF